MGNGKALGIIGLILGIVGVLLGGYVFLESIIAPDITPDIPPSLIDQYYVEDERHDFYDSFAHPLGLELNCSVYDNAKVYMVFNCYIMFAADELVKFNFTIDGIYLAGPMTARGSSSLWPRQSLSMQYYNASFLSGIHVIGIEARGETSVDLFTLSLYIQITY